MDRVYCLALCADGRWLLLNRQYKPFGTDITEWVDYDTCPGTRVRLTDEQVEQLTSLGHPPAYIGGHFKVWLYRDSTSSRSPEQQMAATVREVVLWGLSDLQAAMAADGCAGTTEIVGGWE